jgi:hypothetical protein
MRPPPPLVGLAVCIDSSHSRPNLHAIYRYNGISHLPSLPGCLMGSCISIEPQVILSLIWYLITVVITKAVVIPGRPLARTLLAAAYRDDGGAVAVAVHTVPPRWLRVLPDRVLYAPLAAQPHMAASRTARFHTNPTHRTAARASGTQLQQPAPAVINKASILARPQATLSRTTR